MKRTLALMTVLLTIAAAGGVGIKALAAQDKGTSSTVSGEVLPPACGPEAWHPGRGRLGMLGRALDLTPEQKAKISAIMEAERPAISTLRTALREGRQALGEAVRSGAFDEGAVRTLATKQAATLTELMVVGARVESKVYALLTPEQRTLAERLRPLLDHRPGPYRPF